MAVCATMIAACGEAAESSPERLSLQSPALVEEAGLIESIRDGYQCQEESVWLPLEWTHLPQGTAELVVTITVSKARYRPGPAGPNLESEYAGAWAIGGLDPSRKGIPIGDLPPGAFMVRESGGPMCPLPSRLSAIQFAVHAMPSGGSLEESDEIDFETVEELRQSSLGTGSVLAFYGDRST